VRIPSSLAALCVFASSSLAQTPHANVQSDTVADHNSAAWEKKATHLNSQIDSFQMTVNSIINSDLTVDALVRQIRKHKIVDSSLDMYDSVRLALERKIDSVSALVRPASTVQEKMDAIHQRTGTYVDKATENVNALGGPGVAGTTITSEILPVSGIAADTKENIRQYAKSNMDDLDVEEQLKKLNSIPQRQIDKLKSTDEAQNIQNRTGQINGYIDSAQGYEQDAIHIVKGDMTQLKEIPNEIERRAAQMSEVRELGKLTNEVGGYSEMIAMGNDPRAMAGLARKQIMTYATDHFAGKQQMLQVAMDKIGKLGSTSGDLSELKEIAKKKLNPLKGKPAGERIVPAFTFQIQKASTFLLDLNPNVGWTFTPRLIAGAGWNERLSFSKWNNVVEGDRIFGPRGFTSFGIGHGFSLKAELERMNVFIPTFYGTMDGSRSWVWSAFAGFKKDYSFYGRISGNFQVLYNLYDDHDCSPYVDKLNVRMGFEFPIKKRVLAPKCSPCSQTTPGH
jgi:hypothetical protein